MSTDPHQSDTEKRSEQGEPLEQLRPTSPSSVPQSSVLRVTMAQQKLLDAMLDPHQPPHERAAAGQQLAAVGDPRPGVGLRKGGLPDIAWVELPGGTIPLGGDGEARESLAANEGQVARFWLAKYLVTNVQWNTFLHADDGYHDERWWLGAPEEKQKPGEPTWSYGNHPREKVSWYEARTFCRWLEYKLGYEVRLPTEDEWERAARGAEGRAYPWGKQYISGYANINEAAEGAEVGPYNLKQTSAVGMYPQGQTPEEVCDLAGNVWEWTGTEWGQGSPAVVLRGGSWRRDHWQCREASRYKNLPHYRGYGFGFRVASSAPGLGAFAPGSRSSLAAAPPLAESSPALPQQLDKVPLRVLFLAANPLDTAWLRLNEEWRTMEERLREGRGRDGFVLYQGWAVRDHDLPRLLLEHHPRPTVVHFAGHSSETGALMLEDRQGQSSPILPLELASLLGVLRDEIQGVVLNACWTEAAAQALVQVGIPWVVGTKRTLEGISDKAAIAFAGGFYRGLGFGRSVGEAVKLGQYELGRVVPAEQHTPELLCGSGVDVAAWRF